MKQKISTSVSELRHAVADTAVAAPEISHWSVGMHIQHCAKSMISVCRGLELSSDEPPRPKRSLSKAFVFTTGIIPRGKARASKTVIPEPGPEQENLIQELTLALEAVEIALQLPPNRWVEHPYFGALRRDQALRFLWIHNRHHSKIIRDILAA